MESLGSIRYTCIPALTADIRRHYAFAGAPVTVSLVCFSENCTYVLKNAGGEKIGIVSLHRPGYHKVAELCDELLWMNEIRRETTVSVPAVYRDRGGHFLRPLALAGMPRLYYSICAYVPGETLEHLAGGCSDDVAQQIGGIAAQLHVQAKRRARLRQPLSCFSWDIPQLLGETARWGTFAAYPATESQQWVLRRAADRLCYQLHSYGKDEETYFLIHADLHAGNLLVQDGTVTLIDFDDCGYSWFLYDLGSFLSRQNEDFGRLIQAWCTGYERIRPLREQDLAMIPTFVLLRRLVRLGWLASHSDNDVAAQTDQTYVEVTVALAEEYVQSSRSTQRLAAM